MKEGLFDINLGGKGKLLIEKTLQDPLWWPDSWAPHKNLYMGKLGHGEIKGHVFWGRCWQS